MRVRKIRFYFFVAVLVVFRTLNTRFKLLLFSFSFAHGRQELRSTSPIYKSRICHFWLTSNCNKGISFKSSSTKSFFFNASILLPLFQVNFAAMPTGITSCDSRRTNLAFSPSFQQPLSNCRPSARILRVSKCSPLITTILQQIQQPAGLILAL